MASGPAPWLRLVNVYTPNSGQTLQRLDYRAGAGGWDAKMRGALSGLDGVYRDAASLYQDLPPEGVLDLLRKAPPRQLTLHVCEFLLTAR